MATSPTGSLKWREMIGEDQFSQRREVFDKHDSVFLPSSPTALAPAAMDVEPIITSNHGKTTSNFRRGYAYSSMKESKRDDHRSENGFRARKYSDNFTSEFNQNDDVDYRKSLTERTRRISKLRRDFLASNLHDPVSPDVFPRAGVRSSLPVRSGSINYKIESPNLYKFPFAEPYATPPPIRRVVVDFGIVEKVVENGHEKDSEDPEIVHDDESFTDNRESVSKLDHHKLFDELVKRYSPQRKPVDWKLPPTKPRVIGSVPKSTSDSIDSGDGKKTQENIDNGENSIATTNEVFANETIKSTERKKSNENIESNADTSNNTKDYERDDKRVIDKPNCESKESDELTELYENNDKVEELSSLKHQIDREPARISPGLEAKPDLTIPDLLKKMNNDGDDVEIRRKDKKIKRKRSFIDKLLGRKKEK